MNHPDGKSYKQPKEAASIDPTPTPIAAKAFSELGVKPEKLKRRKVSAPTATGNSENGKALSQVAVQATIHLADELKDRRELLAAIGTLYLENLKLRQML